MNCKTKDELKTLCRGKEWRKVVKLLEDGYKGVFVLLRILRDSETEVFSADLAKQLGVSTARIATALNTLERKGYTKRTPSTEDGRKVAISLTTQGAQALEKREKEIDCVVDSLLTKLSEDEQRAFFVLVKKLLQ